MTKKFFALALTTFLGLSVFNVPSSAAAMVSSQFSLADQSNGVIWTYKFEHEDFLECSWENVYSGYVPRYPINGVGCNLKYTLTWDWKPIGASADPSFLDRRNGPSITLSRIQIVDASGKNVTAQQIGNDIQVRDYVWFETYSEGKIGKIEGNLLIAFTGPGTIFIKYPGWFGDKKALVSEIQSPINVKGLTREAAMSEWAAAEKRKAEENALNAKKAADAVAARNLEEDRKYAQRKMTITCKKGKTTKRVVGDPPECPKGYTNSLENYLPYQAFVKCKFYKKENEKYSYSKVELVDNGKTLVFTNVGSLSGFAQISYSDLSCAIGILKAPTFVVAQINSTRPIDGVQRANWSAISAFWSLDSKSGLNAAFTIK